MLIDAAASVEHPDDDGGSLLARWNPPDSGRDEPAIGNLGGGSDHVGFYTHLGIPSMWPGMGGASLYHSGYDDFAFYERFCDPDFAYGPAVARLNGLLALRLANADVLPYALARYPTDLATHVADLRKLAEANHRLADWSELDQAITGLDQAVSDWDVARADLIDSEDDRRLPAVNEALLGLEKAFLAEGGLQNRPWSRSLYATPDPFSGYASWMLPGLRYEVLEGGADSLAHWMSTYADAVNELTARVAALTELAAL